MSVFKACDIRGRYGAALNPGLALQVGRAVGSKLRGRAVVVGGDLRPSTPPLKGALVEGIVQSGGRVLDVGILPTPAFYFAKAALGAPGAVMVTGSHNPPEDNGFKITLGDLPLSPEEMAELEALIARGDFPKGEGSYETRDVQEAYETSLAQRFAGGRPKRVLVDAGNGGYSVIAPRVLRRLGHQVEALFCEPDGRFPNRSPNPSVAANLRAAQEALDRETLDLGVAYDGDGDRAVFLDERGRVIEGDRSIVLLARHLLAERPPDGGPAKVIYDLKCSSVVPEEVRRAGGHPIMERSGHAFIKTALLRCGALLGGEVSGHFFFGELGYDDALFATLMMLQVLEQGGGPLSALVDGVPRYPITPDIRVPCPPEQGTRILQELEAAFAQDPGAEVVTLDGVRIGWPDGWALVRPSVTEPLMTLRFEGRTPERLLEIQSLVAERSPLLRRIWRPPHGGI